MKVSIFGASGATGILLTERCLAAGYEVTALVRTPERFAFTGPSAGSAGDGVRCGGGEEDG